MNETIISCENLNKIYKENAATISILQGLNFKVEAGASIAIVGPSGSGKSTLLHLLGGLDKPTEGKVLFKNSNWQDLSERQRCLLRAKHLGFIYQFHHLLPEFSALENVAMPMLLAGIEIEKAKNQALEILRRVGLSSRTSHKPAHLSGGERQRVAIARAIVTKPTCILADEPTGNLDQQNAHKIFELLLELNQELSAALVIVTHDSSIAERMEQVFTLQVGSLVG